MCILPEFSKEVNLFECQYGPGPVNNQVKIPEKPGLGFEPNYDTLKDSMVKDPEKLMEAGMQTNLDVITKA